MVMGFHSHFFSTPTLPPPHEAKAPALRVKGGNFCRRLSKMVSEVAPWRAYPDATRSAGEGHFPSFSPYSSICHLMQHGIPRPNPPHKPQGGPGTKLENFSVNKRSNKN
jgi:hypothetical protein